MALPGVDASVARLLSALGLVLVCWLGSATPAAARSDVAVAELPALFVRVTDATTDVPVAGADVLVSFVGGDINHPIITGKLYEGVANGGGHVLFKGLQPGGYVISVSAVGYVSFGDGARGDRPPSGAGVMFGGYRQGSGAAGNVGIHIAVRLLPLAPCRTCP